MEITHNFFALRLYYYETDSIQLISRKSFSIPTPRRFVTQSVSLRKEPVSISIAANQNQDSFTLHYLVHSCGLSLEAAISASEKIQLKSPEKADAILAFLQNRGFSKTQISSLVKKWPLLLLANPEKTLLPKFEFFQSIGISSSQLAKTLSSSPTLLTRSLHNKLIPSYEILKGVLLTDERVVSALKRSTWIFLLDHSKTLLPNITLLRNIGVPDQCIALLLANYPEAVMQKHEEFSKAVNEVREMKFDIKKSTFVLAVHAISGESNKSLWKRCFEVYRKWGWSKDDIFVAFKKHPGCMMLSEKKIAQGLDMFVNKMGWPSKVLVQSPMLLFFSLEKRIIPRCKVIKVLACKGLVKEDLSLNSVMLPAEKFFLKRFVTNYEEEVPQLWRVYKGELNPEQV